MGEMIMRPCGGSWEYCDGDCCHCEKANLTTSNSTTITKTNADHIRSMTDEELADYMSEHSIEDFCYLVCGGHCKAFGTLNKTSSQVCREIVADWLKQPYEEEP